MRMVFLHLPEILVLHLIRFKELHVHHRNQGTAYVKNDAQVILDR